MTDQYLAIFWTVAIVCVTVDGQSPPGPPDHVTVVSDAVNLAVQWEPPSSAYGVIRRYIVTWAILPNTTDIMSVVGGGVTMTIISVAEYPGRLYRIRVRAATDAGIGAYSPTRYVRIGCGRTIEVAPGQNVTVTSPGYDVTTLQPGVVCVWTLQTLKRYTLTISIEILDLVSEAGNNTSCGNSLLNVADLEEVCILKDGISRTIDSTRSNMTLMLKTGLEAGGEGFSLVVSSVVKMPGPPTFVSINTTEHAILLSWQPPREVTLPITAYNIRYGIMGSPDTRLVTMSAGMLHFTVNTDREPGKVWWLRLSALIGRLQGDTSRVYYVRAPCTKRYVVSPGISVNVTSPGFPHEYPSNIICMWHITMTPPTTITSDVAFTVTYVNFTLEDTTLCSSDYVMFSFRHVGQQECSRALAGHVITTHVTNFTITFVTDGRRQYSGFLMRVTAAGNTSESTKFATTIVSTTISLPETTSSLTQLPWTLSAANQSFPPTDGTTAAYINTTRDSRYNDTIPSGSSNNAQTTSHVTLTLVSVLQPTSHIRYNTSNMNISVPITKESQRLTTMSISQTLDTRMIDSFSSTEDTRNQGVTKNSTVVPTVDGSGEIMDGILGNASSHYAEQTLTSTEKRNVGMSGGSVFVIILVSTLVTLTGLVTAVWCRNKHRRRHVHPTQRDMNNSIPLHDIISRASSGKDGRTVSWASPKVTSPRVWDGRMPGKQRKERCYSFPDCFSVRHRKIRRDIKKALASLDFIEDVESLCATLERKYSQRRTNSF